MQVFIQTAAGAGVFPQQVRDSLLGLVEFSGKILKSVYAGDTLYPLLTITGIKPQKTTGIVTMRAGVHNQASTLVFEGEHKYLIRKRPNAT